MIARPVARRAAGKHAEAEIRRMLADVREGSWFAAVGEPCTAGEKDEAELYLAALGYAGTGIVWLPDWDAARSVSQRADWNRDWWESEQTLQRDLYAAASDSNVEGELLHHLTAVTEAATSLLHGPAAVAAALAGVADPGLIRAAAGAAAQTCHQAALNRLVGGKPGRCFEAKFRLFTAGRWPLTLTGDRFHVF